MAWDIGADEYGTGGATTYTRQAALDAVLAPITKTAAASVDARIIGSGAGGGPWDIGADELTGTEALAVGLDAHVVDLTNSQTVTASAGAAIAPATPSGLAVVAASNTWVSLSWTDNSGGTAQHRVYYRKISESTYTDWALLMEGDTTDTVYYLTPDTVYVFAVAAVSLDGVEGPIITTTYPSVPGGEITASMISYTRGPAPVLTCSVGAFVAYSSTGPVATTTRTVTGRYL